MTYVHIRLNHTEKRKAIHLRHHYIADHEIILFICIHALQKLVQSITTTCHCCDIIIATQFLNNIITYLSIIIHYQHPIVRLGLSVAPVLHFLLLLQLFL